MARSVLVSQRQCWRWLVAVGLAAAVVLANAPAGAATIYVKLLVDEEEPAAESQWRQRLARRLAAASAVIEQYANVRFTATRFEVWKSEDGVTDFERSLTEFERVVQPAPADLAIGFTSQYRFTPGRHHLGGIRGPLRPHILIRESNPQITEAERVEVLVHELGHYLGAVHSPRRDSVMRPTLGDGQARLQGFRMAFDPENATIIRLVAQEIDALGVRHFAQLSEDTRRRLRREYADLVRKMPEDAAAAHYLKLLEAAGQ